MSECEFEMKWKMDLRIDSPRSSFRLCVLILKILEDLSFQSKISFVPSFQMFTPFEQISLHFHKNLYSLSLSLSSSKIFSVEYLFSQWILRCQGLYTVGEILDDISPSFSLLLDSLSFFMMMLWYYSSILFLILSLVTLHSFISLSHTHHNNYRHRQTLVTHTLYVQYHLSPVSTENLAFLITGIKKYSVSWSDWMIWMMRVMMRRR